MIAEKINATRLSELTKRNYLSRVSVLERMLKKDIEDIIAAPEASLADIKRYWTLSKTQKNFIVCILALRKHIPEFNERHKDAFEKWADALADIDEKIRDIDMYNMPSERQKKGYIPFDSIREKIKKLSKGSVERMLIAMYTLIEPLRADYNRLKIYKGAKVPDDNTEDNWLLLKNARTMIMHIGEHKTVKTHGVIERNLPTLLQSEIKTFLFDKPDRNYLFQERDGKPFSANAFSQWANRKFRQIFNIPLTITIIRHAFINTLDLNNLSQHQRNEIAKNMAHSPSQQLNYRLIMNEGENKN